MFWRKKLNVYQSVLDVAYSWKLRKHVKVLMLVVRQAEKDAKYADVRNHPAVVVAVSNIFSLIFGKENMTSNVEKTCEEAWQDCTDRLPEN